MVMGDVGEDDDIMMNNSSSTNGRTTIHNHTKDDETSDDDGFMNVIGRLGLGDLDQEPQRLQDVINELDQDMKQLSVQHYEIHIKNAQCLDTIERGARESTNRTVTVLENLPDLTSELKRFRKVGQRIADAHTRNTQTLQKHVQLLELLGIPQLMETFTRGNFHDEALELSSYTNTLEKRHLAISKGVMSSKSHDENDIDNKKMAPSVGGAGTTIISAIAEEVYLSSSHMRKQLLQELRQDMNLPKCLKIIFLLKRLDAQERARKKPNQSGETSSSFTVVKDDTNLRFEFLACRDAYIASISTEDASSYVSKPYQSSLKLIERCRVNWFDVITQYRSIFTSGEVNNNNLLSELSDDQGILSRWVCGKMDDFLLSLGKAVSNIEDFGSLSNVFEQALKFGQSLAKMGADFRPLLIEPFKRRIIQLMVDFWKQAVDRAIGLIVNEEWGAPLPMPKELSSNNKTNKKKDTNTEDVAEKEQVDNDDKTDMNSTNVEKKENTIISEEEEKDTSLTPPYVLLEFPVAAEFTNIILSSFNELRQCASPIFAVELGKLFVLCVDKFPDALEQYKTRDDAEKKETVDRFNQLCQTLAQKMFPFLQLCFDTLFHKQHMSIELRTLVPLQDLQTRLLDSVIKQEPKFDPVGDDNTNAANNNNNKVLDVVEEEQQHQEENNNNNNSEKQI